MELRVKRAPRIEAEITVPGDKSISHRAAIIAEGPDQTHPLRIRGGSLRGIHYRSPVASAQVKSAILLAGLFAKGKTTVDEPSASRNHTELMFNYFLIRTAKSEDAISVFGDQIPESRDFSIPGDISSAAFWLVAAAAQSGGHLLVRNIGLTDTRTALLGVLVRMGAQVREEDEGGDELQPRGVVGVVGVSIKSKVMSGIA